MKKRCISPVDNSQAETSRASNASDNSIKASKDSLVKQVLDMRHAMGFTQEQVEAESGVQQAVIYRLERGVTDPKLTTILRVLRPLGMTLSIVPLNKDPR